MNILESRDKAEHVKKNLILKEQMGEERGGQIIEIGHKVGDKEVAIIFCDTIISGEKGTIGSMTMTKKPYAKWVIVQCHESLNMGEKFGQGLAGKLKSML